MNSRGILTGLFVICVGLPAISFAQPNSAVEQLERTQREMQSQKPMLLNLSTNVNAPETYPGENEDIGPQRILRLKPKRNYFEVVADSQYFYTDNALLSDQAKVSSTLFVNTIQAAFAPPAYKLGPGLFAPVVGFRSQWFNYGLGDGNGPGGTTNSTIADGLDRLDFVAQTAFIAGRYQMGKWVYSVGFDFTRLLDQVRYDESYREYMPSIGVQRFFPISDNLLFSVGAQADYRFTEIPTIRLGSSTNSIVVSPNSDANDRFDVSLALSMNWQIIPKLIFSPYYRFQYTRYLHFANDNASSGVERNDFVNSVGASLAYYFNKNISVRIFASYEIKDSDFSRAVEYQKFDAGGGLSLNIRF